MPPIVIRKVKLASTTGYGAPGEGFPRVHLVRNGVQMLAAVNGRGAYDANGPKKQRRKAKRKAAKARSYSTKARRKGISATKRAQYRRKATKATRKAKKRRSKAEYQKYVKRMARKAGLGRKELIRLLRGEGLSGKAAASVASCAVGGGGACASSPYGPGAASVSDTKAAAESVEAVVKKAKKRRKPDFSYIPNGPDAEIFFDNGKVKTMAGRKRKRKAGRKAARRGTRKVARRGKSRRSRSSSRRRTSSKRRSTKRSRKAGRRSTARGRGRRGMRRNGSDDFEMNGGLEYEANGDDFEMNGSDDFESNGYDFESNAKKRGKGKKRKSPSKASKFNKKLLKETGLLTDFGPEPVAGMMIDVLAAKLDSGEITLDAYKRLRKQVAKSYFPKQEGRGGKIGLTVTDPITGKSKVVKVPWKGKVRTAFGPYKRRKKGDMYTYEWDKGQKIPAWAMVGAYTGYEDQILSKFDADFAAKSNAAKTRILEARSRVAAAEQAELNRKIEKLSRKLASGQVDDPMTPNKRGSGRRRGKRRMSAAQLKYFGPKAKRRGKRKSSKRRSTRKGSKRRSSKRRGSSRRRVGSKRRRTGSKRRSSKRRGSSRRRVGSKRRSSKRRGSSKRRSRKGGRRSYKRRGRKGFRKNFMGDTSWGELAAAGILGAGGALALSMYAAPHLVPVLSFAGQHAGTLGALLLAFGGAAATIAIGKRVAPQHAEAVEAAALGMVAVAGGTALFSAAMSGMSGIPYVNTSGWGSRRPVGAYELRGAGAYELRGLGAYPQQALAGGQYAQAMASYELRGMGAYPQQALAGGQYAQAMAAYELRGLGQDTAPTQDILPAYSDTALDWMDAQAGGEYVNTQLQPIPPLFFQDPLKDIGVPNGTIGGGIPHVSIWDPTGESFVDPTATVGGNFDDPNV